VDGEASDEPDAGDRDNTIPDYNPIINDVTPASLGISSQEVTLKPKQTLQL